jgi:hypothetical protein
MTPTQFNAVHFLDPSALDLARKFIENALNRGLVVDLGKEFQSVYLFVVC